MTYEKLLRKHVYTWLGTASAASYGYPVSPKMIRSPVIVSRCCKAPFLLIVLSRRSRTLEMNSAGKYRSVLKQVNGPIVVTFTKSDYPLHFAFPAAARAGGHVGELDERQPRDLKNDAYLAIGANGFPCDPARILTLKKSGILPLVKGLNVVDGNGIITGHNAICNESVARLTWTAISKK